MPTTKGWDELEKQLQKLNKKAEMAKITRLMTDEEIYERNRVIFGSPIAIEIAKAARNQEYEDWLSQPAGEDGAWSNTQSNILQAREDLETAIAEEQYWGDQIYRRTEELNKHRTAYNESQMEE